MNSFYDKSNYTQNDIENLIGEEENLHLEFKDKDSLKRNQKMEISKDISAFANSTGGIIIYGIKEEDHVAKEFSFIDGNEITKEWIEDIIYGNIERRLTGVEIIPIRFDDDFNKTIYVIKISQSINSPHMCGYKKYYKRNNFQSIAMEEYEVRDSYSRVSKTKLKIEELVIQVDSYGGTQHKFNTIGYKLMFHVKNISNNTEPNFKFMFSIPSSIIFQTSFEPSDFFLGKDGNNHKFLVSVKDPIYPGELYKVHEQIINFSKNTFMNLDNFYINLALYYTGGVEEEKVSLKDKLFIDKDCHSKLSIENFR
ncbi:MAG: ATP-binding protein [Ignavibacteria bacterium]|nr:ATP-binding protein [Ignavibacteria bacterium]